MLKLYDVNGHLVVVFRDLTPKGVVQTNQAVFVDHGEALLADPSGRIVFNRLLSELNRAVPISRVKYVFYSHQDPDVSGAAASWRLAAMDAKVLISQYWVRFVPHMFPPNGTDDFYVPVPDEGMEVELGETKLLLVPTHFLHSPAAFSLYDPASKILFSGDVGASLFPEGVDYDFADDFDSHVQYMEPFHRRFMASRRACRAWAAAVRRLDVETIVSQHGAILRGRGTVERFLDWLEGLECGVDVLYGKE